MAGIVVEWKIGALAQLGEHLLCKQRVIGSIPIGSTIIIQTTRRTSLQSSLRRGAACFSYHCEEEDGSRRIVAKEPARVLPPTPGRCIRSKHGFVGEGFWKKVHRLRPGHNALCH
jgi:hypothetical protein